MDLNLARLVIQLSPGSAVQFSSALLDNSSAIEASLGQLCLRQLSSDPELLRRHQKPSVPFVFELPAHSKAGISSVALLLMGPSIPCLSLFIDAIENHSGKEGIISIKALDYQGSATDISCDGDTELPVLSAADILELEVSNYSGCPRILIEISSPLRIYSEGRELSRFDPSLFVRSMLRRVSSLAAYYGNGSDPDKFRELAFMAGSLKARYCGETEMSFKKRGLTGIYEISGNCLDELGPYLALGSIFNLGKGASFGMGKFTSEPLS